MAARLFVGVAFVGLVMVVARLTPANAQDNDCSELSYNERIRQGCEAADDDCDAVPYNDRIALACGARDDSATTDDGDASPADATPLDDDEGDAAPTDPPASDADKGTGAAALASIVGALSAAGGVLSIAARRIRADDFLAPGS